ncbi:EamA family transporter RarD [Halalkalibacillus halophilus]|uniref:EamA family transporter RarD n=1 Tax=Halalkalibacillus halophilus TaxID=392827 RepID=UPI0004117E01|nr:EamA family transporter RarD [Halalkalibacillus halophilus]
MNEEKLGTIYAAFAYIIWGFLPLYWKILEHVPAWEILAHRMVWSFLFMVIFILALKRWGLFTGELKSIFKDWRTGLGITGAAIAISINWVTYIWAVNTNHVLDASLGYYINPLISILFGILFLGEKFSRIQWIAIAFALTGVLFMTIQFGSIPWVALVLAMSFAVYGLLKKVVQLNAIFGLAIETLIILPIALLYISYLEWVNVGALGMSWTGFLLIGAGLVTVVPLLLFAQGAKRIPLSLVGFLQYFAPTIMLLLGVFLFDEAFTSVHAVTFTLIWIGLILYTYERMKHLRKNAHA